MMFKKMQTINTLCTLMITAALLCSTVSAAGVLHGRVTDKSDGSALFSALISLKSIDNPNAKLRGTATDENGNYEITDIPEGNYNITISFVGFAAHRAQSVTIPAKISKQMNISLTPTLLDLDAITVTASRRAEKVLEAPAAVSVVSADQIAARAALSPTEHIKGLPAVDVASTGLNQSNVVVRGFNNIFSGVLLVLTDNRIARVPSLRFNAHNFISVINEDIERIELVSGPGSALYGPNSAGGVMHIITKSPFGSEGTTVTVGGGGRDLGLGSFRHAGNFNNRIGYKFSGQYYQGTDWESSDAAEPDTIQLFNISADGKELIGKPFANKRDFDIKKISGEGRFDFLLNENTTLIVNGGFNQSSSIELTGLGAGQATNWRYMYGQARLTYKDLFVQGFVNASDAGDTYLLQTGQMIVDKSKLMVAQIQHRYSVSEKTSLIYGVDGLFTRPSTDGTINGRNEDDDNINEVGVYLQSETQLTEKFKFVGAARYDNNSRLENPVFSPRAALAFQPTPDHNFRVTYNRAYSTPDNNNLFLDILQSQDPFGVGASFAPLLGFSPDIDVRVQGVPESGFHWNINSNGPQFRSSFALAHPANNPLYGGTPGTISSSDFIDFNDPTFTNVMWTLGSGAVASGFSDQMNGLAALGQIRQGQADTLISLVAALTPGTIPGVNNTMMSFNPDTRSFDPVTLDDIADIERMEPTITQTFELGYKGIVNNRFKFTVDAYRTKKNNFVGPLTVETPNVFLDPATLSAYLGSQFGGGYAGASSTDSTYLLLLDNPAFGGNNNGTPVDELATMFTSGAARIPFGTVTPKEQLDPDAVLVTYRNFGDVTFYGVDLSFAYHLNRNWNVGGTYSHVTKNFFPKSADQVHDINLNAPKNKFGLSLQYAKPNLGLTVSSRLRWVEAFNMSSPFVGTTVQEYTLVDLNAGLDIWASGHFSLTVQNLFDEEHIEFVGAPALGRLAIARITQTF